jgi:DNA polymerase-1
MQQLALTDVEFRWPAPHVIQTRSGLAIELRSKLVQTVEQLQEMEDTLAPAADIVYDSETSGLNPRLGARIAGHALATFTAQNVVTAWYAPVRHLGGYNEAQTQLDPETVVPVLRRILQAPGRCGMHHAKFDFGHLRNDGVDVTRVLEDTSIDAVIANENEYSFGLKFLADKYCFKGARTEEKSLEDWMRADARKLGIAYRKRKRGETAELAEDPTYLERFGFARSPIQLCGAYACKDVFYTLYLWLVTFAHVAKRWPELHAREHQISRILHKMEWTGLAVDAPMIRDAHDRARAEVEHWLTECRKHAGESFSGTDGELRKLFYVQLGMEPQRFTKGGRAKTPSPSVDKIALKLLAERYPSNAPLITAASKLARARKIYTTYTGSFLRFLSSENRVHPSYNQLEQRDAGGVPVTGRLSSSDPNATNVDSRTLHLHTCECAKCLDGGEAEMRSREGRSDAEIYKPNTIEVHRYFVVPEGFIRFYIDFSQIELRVLTWFCQDPVLLDCYRNGLDVHQIIADQLGIERKVSKQVNFGNSYGMTEIGLAQRLPGYYTDPEATIEFAKRVLAQYFQRYSRIREFRDSFAAQMVRNGCEFLSPFGRPRRIPLVKSHKHWERSRGQRMMMSSIISGTSADIMKESMIRCDALLENRPAPSGQKGMLVQSVHDELVFDYPLEPGWARVLLELKKQMEDWPQFSNPKDRVGVPIKVNVEVTTTTWADKRPVGISDDGRLWWAA